MKEFDPRTSPMSGDLTSDRTKDADGTHEVSRTANEMRAVSERRDQPTVVDGAQQRNPYTSAHNLALATTTHPSFNTLYTFPRTHCIARALPSPSTPSL